MPKRPKQYLKKSLFLLFGLALVVAGSLGYDVSVIRAAPCTASGNDVTISTDCEFAAGTYHYTGTLTIEAGVTVTMQGNTSTGEGVTLVSDNFEINGTLTADSQGYAGGSNSSDDGDGPGGGVSSTGFAQGASHGGRGSNNNPNGEYGSVFAPIDLGSGGGNDGESGGPGDGGGAFKLFLYDNGTVTLGDGATLTANGGNASTADHGGGSGGSIWIDAPNGTLTLASTHTATVRANGGRTAVNDGGGAGGGGRIAVYAGTCTNCDNITYQAFGGAQGEQSGAFIEGGAGSIFLKLDGATNGDAIYDNNDQVGSEETTLVASSTQIVDNLTVRKGADLQIPDTFRAELAAGGLLTGGGTVQPRLVVFGGGIFDSASSTFLIDSIDILHRGDIEGVTNLVVQDAEYQVNPDTARFPEQADNRLDGLTLLSGGIFESENDDPFYLDALEARSGSTLRHLANGTSEIYKLNISATSTIDVQSGATVNLDGLGYTGSFATGPGAGPGGGGSSGFSGGGGHGGKGGHELSTDGDPYGSPTDPDTIGSAGGNDGEAGTSGSGGGAVKLSVASGGTITLNANVTADGTNSSNADHGGGAGGSIWIDAVGATIAGTATLAVNGGRGISNQGGGGGAGGRIAVYYGTDNSTWTKQAIGGLSGTQSGSTIKEGGAGTIYIKSDAATNGELIVDNGGRTSANETPQLGASETYDDVTIADGTKYTVPSGITLAIASGGTLTGGGVQPSLTIADGGIFDTGNATFTFDSIDVVNSGDIGSVTDLTITSSTFTHNSTGDFTAGGGVTSLTLSSGTVIDNGGANINISSLTIPSGSAYTLNEENYYPWDAGFGALSVTGTFTSQRLATIFIDSLTVPSGGNVTHADNAATKQYVLDMSATSTIDVQSGGSLNVDAKGHSTANGPGAGTSGTFQGSGGGYGGNGGIGGNEPRGSAYGSVTSPDDIGSGGGSDGNNSAAGGAGGGYIRLAASSGTITVNGTVSADGQQAQGSSTTEAGGGSGGGIKLDADTVAGTGTVTANGGSAQGSGNGSGGGGGRIAVRYSNGDPTAWALNAGGGFNGGASGNQEDGGGGTIYLKSSAQTNGDLIVTNNERPDPARTPQLNASETYDAITIKSGSIYEIGSGETLTLASGGSFTGGGTQQAELKILLGGTFDTGNATFTFDDIDVEQRGALDTVTDLTFTNGTYIVFSDTVTYPANGHGRLVDLAVGSGGTFDQRNTSVFYVEDLIVQSGGTVTHGDNSSAKAHQVSISATNTVDVQTGGAINVNALGYDADQGPGAGNNDEGSESFRASGGGHGGDGGDAGGQIGGPSNGSVTHPVDLGSGGGTDDDGVGSSGGGAVRLVANAGSGTVTINGTISADAATNATQDAGGGAGGSVLIDADTVTGTGSVTVIGGIAPQTGTGNELGGGGAGGRIAIHYDSNTSNLTFQAHGGVRGPHNGNNTGDGGAGTVYLKDNAAANGELIVDNGDRTSSNHTTQIGASETYAEMTVSSGAKYKIDASKTLTIASGGSFTGGGTQQAELEILLGGTFDTGNATFTFDDIDVEQRGALDTVTDLTFTNGTYIVFSDTVTYPANGHGRLVDLTVGSGGTFDQRNTSVFYVEDLIVQSGGTVTHGDNSSGKAHQISISATNTVDVQSGGSVDINAKGMDASLGGGASDAFGEAGTFTSEADGGWTTINFNNSYTTPVVVGTTNSHNGQAALVFEARNVTSTSAEMRVCESEGSSSTGCDTHAAETVGYMVIDAADLDEIDGIEAGTFSVDGEVDTTTHSVSYSEGFGSTPRVFLNVNTVNGTAPTEPLLTTTSTTGFTAGLCQQNSLDGCDSTHVSETVGWIAIEPGFTFSSLNDSGTVSVSDSNFTSVSFSTSFSSAPVVLASTQTNNGGQHPKNDEARNVTTSGAEVRYCETESGDSCDTHAAETVAWLAVEAGDLAATIGAGGNSFSGGGGGHGGRGGAGGGSAETEGLANGSATEPVNLGSGGGNDTNQGGSGGSGGGAVKIVASGTLTVNGTVSANGQNTPQNDDAGGGAGGSVWLDADTLAGSGTVTVNGGNAVNSQGGGGGGGGRIALYFTTDSSSLTLQAIGGDEGNQSGFVGEDGGAGTIYKKDKDLTNGDLIVDNADRNTSETTPQQLSSVTYANITVASGAHYVIGNTRSLTITDSITGGGTQIPTLEAKSGTTFDPPATTSFTTLTIINDADSGTLTDLTIGTSGHWRQLSTNNIFSGSSLTIEDGGTFTQEHKDTISVDTVTIESGGTLTHCDNATTHDCEVDFSVTTFDVQTGGVVTADALGFDSDNGPGAGTAGDAGGGGGYGGAGGDSSTGVSGGSTYGSETDPIDLGSGGGDDTDQGPSNEGGSGAGAIILTVSTTLTVNGDILADGQDGISNGGGGGSGGTVNINVSGTWEGNGCISADGGDGSNSGGGGGGGRIRIVFGTKTYTGCTPEANAGTSPSGDAGTTGTTSEGQDAPTVDSVTHSPATPEVGDDVHLACQASKPDGGIKKIEIFLDGTDPGDLQKTCNFSPAETPANCDVSVGSLSAGSHTTTCRATDTSDATAEDTDTFDVISRTTGNKVTLSDLKVNAVATGVVTMTFSATSSGTLTVDWPSDFTVDAAATDAASDDCFSSFGFTSSTLTATKTDCTGTVEFGGFTVTNPSTAGPYTITWENDTGSATVIIVDDGDFNISASVDATITFNAGSQAAATACDGTFSGDGGTVALGQLTTSSVTTSDSGGIAHICIRASTNASGGATVTVASANGALASASVPGDTIPSSTETLTANDEGYGLCVGSGGTDTGTDTTTPASAAVTRESPFDGTCTTSDHNVGGLTTSPQALWSASGPTQNAFGRIYVKASISGTTAPHDDYTDTLTFILTGTY